MKTDSLTVNWTVLCCRAGPFYANLTLLQIFFLHAKDLLAPSFAANPYNVNISLPEMLQ